MPLPQGPPFSDCPRPGASEAGPLCAPSPRHCLGRSAPNGPSILALRQDGLLDAVVTLGALPPQKRQRLFANKASRLNAWLRHENLQLAEETAEREFADEVRRHRERVTTADRERCMQIQAYEGQYTAFQTEAQKYLHGSGITYQARKQLLACLQSVQRRIGAN
jgi:hypothetical protein